MRNVKYTIGTLYCVRRYNKLKIQQYVGCRKFVLLEANTILINVLFKLVNVLFKLINTYITLNPQRY